MTRRGPLNDALKKQLSLDDAVLVRLALAEVANAEGHGDDRARPVARSVCRPPPARGTWRRSICSRRCIATSASTRSRSWCCAARFRSTASRPRPRSRGTTSGSSPLAERHDEEAFAAFRSGLAHQPGARDVAPSTRRPCISTVRRFSKNARRARRAFARGQQERGGAGLLRGCCVARARKFDDALAAFQRAFALDNNTVDALFDAAQVLADPLSDPRGDPLYQQFLELAPDSHPKVKEASEKLAELRKGVGNDARVSLQSRGGVGVRRRCACGGSFGGGNAHAKKRHGRRAPAG